MGENIRLAYLYLAKRKNHRRPGWHIASYPSSFIEHNDDVLSWCVNNLNGYYEINADEIYIIDEDDLFLFKLTWGFDDSTKK
jgi:hypothetical protein